MRYGFTLFCQLEAQLAAGLSLAVERLRNRHRAAHLTEKQNLHLKIAAVVFDSQEVANVDLARGLGRLSLGHDPAELTCVRRERTRLEESRGPEPLVHSHDPILVRKSPQEAGSK